MDFYASDSTRGRAAVAGLLIGSLGVWLGWIAIQGPSWANRLGEFLATAGAIVLLAGGLQAIFYLIERTLAVEAQRRQIAAMSPQARLLELASRLNDEQARAIPGLDYRATEIDLLDSTQELILYLVTPQGRIPLNWLKDYLAKCAVTRLYPIRNYSEGTAGYEWARAFTAWAIERGYAMESAGSQPAQWANEQIRSGLQARFNIVSDLYDQRAPTR